MIPYIICLREALSKHCRSRLLEQADSTLAQCIRCMAQQLHLDRFNSLPFRKQRLPGQSWKKTWQQVKQPLKRFQHGEIRAVRQIFELQPGRGIMLLVPSWQAESAERLTRAELDTATSKRAELECQASAAQSEADSARRAGRIDCAADQFVQSLPCDPTMIPPSFQTCMYYHVLSDTIHVYPNSEVTTSTLRKEGKTWKDGYTVSSTYKRIQTLLEWGSSRIAATSAQQRLAKSQLLGQHLSEAGRSLSAELKRRQRVESELRV